MRRLIALALLLGGVPLGPGAARAEEPLWTEGGRGAPALSAANPQAFIRLARTLGPAVVHIVAFASDDGGAERPRSRTRGQGTGFVIHRSGYILSNEHVVDGADDVRVRLADERELSARVIGKDKRTDIALLKVEAGGELPVAPLGNSDDVQIGEWVVAIGNPFGLDHSVTAGIVSAKGRREVRPGGEKAGFYDFIQTDASINPGNSGGPLINTRGEVIGINTAMNAQAQGIGFAIPINMAKVIAPLLRQHGRAPRSTIGVVSQPVNAALRRAFGLGETRGALLAEVTPDSPAALAGLRVGDVVIEYDGRPLKRPDDLGWLVATAPAGRRIALSVVRGGRPLKLELAPIPVSDEAVEAPAAAKPPARKSPLGMTVSEISPGIARELGNPALRGVVVMSVEPESPAIEAGVERGDLILRVGEAPVEALDDYARAVRAVRHGDMLRVLVRRDGRSLWVAFLKR